MDNQIIRCAGGQKKRLDRTFLEPSLLKIWLNFIFPLIHDNS